MTQCLISLGANLGQPQDAIRQSAECLAEQLSKRSNDFRLSPLYRTPPVGGPTGQPPFVNAVAAVETELSAWEVWRVIRDIESQLGRVRQRRWEARKIDLDILLHGDSRIWSPQFKVPHPRMCMRRFILIPARDVAPECVDPVTGWSIRDLADGLQRGPGSLKVIVSGRLTDSIVARACHLSGAFLMHGDDGTEVAPCSKPSRFVCLERRETGEANLGPTDSESSAQSHGAESPKLTIMLAESGGDDSGEYVEAWEVRHQELASQLNLCGADEKPIVVGPRYLLPVDDPEWACHEIVSALEAMDCPIERI